MSALGPTTLLLGALRFERELALLGAALAVVLLVVAFALQARGERRLLRHVHPSRLASFAPWRSSLRPRLRAAAAAGCVLCASIALAGPLLGVIERPAVQRGVDLVVCFDSSRSMLARDLKPSRFERAQREVRGLLSGIGGDRVALIAFAGDARIVAPLTTDMGVLADLVGALDLRENRVGGTDLSVAIDAALELFDGRTGASEAIVLVTDGEDLEGQGLAAAERAAERGIAVFVVGIGTRVGGKIPVVEADGSEGFLRDEAGEEVVTRLEDDSLVALAEASGGAYASTESSPSPLEALYRGAIAKLDARDIRGGIERVPADRFQWPLALALVFAGCDLVLREHRRPARAVGARAGLAAWPLLGGLACAAAFGARLGPALAAGGQAADPAAPAAPAAAPAMADAGAGAAQQLVASVPPDVPADARLALEEVFEQVAAGAHEAAIESVEAALAGARERPDRDRAALEFALGALLSRATVEAALAGGAAPEGLEQREARALQAFEQAHFLAGQDAAGGPSALRLAALYDAGTLRLFAAEREFRKVVDDELLAQSAGAPPGLPGGPPGAAPGGGEAAPDLEALAEKFRAARAPLVEHLRLGSAAADVRSNLEWIQRRLRDLQRMQEQQEQEQQDQQDQQDQDQQDQQDSQEQQDPQDEQQSADEQSEGQPQQEPQDPSEAESQDGEQQPEPETQQEQSPEEQGSAEEQAAEQEAAEQAAAEELAAEQAEGLSDEEILQLLRRLEQIEEQVEARRQAVLQQNSTRGVPRDW